MVGFSLLAEGIFGTPSKYFLNAPKVTDASYG